MNSLRLSNQATTFATVYFLHCTVIARLCCCCLFVFTFCKSEEPKKDLRCLKDEVIIIKRGLEYDGEIQTFFLRIS
ncbi:hypothetical protein BCR42DRAFT_185839 [Absidia repens]|uniref:Uncharacterized protein n=1 Tax=Absidia repens TaxID=90262 RepID=A0A1X2HXD5_9FUNG|nr:hypothetical protein BCR42DRAFT_185839 [Absidia repens]